MLCALSLDALAVVAAVPPQPAAVSGTRQSARAARRPRPVDALAVQAALARAGFSTGELDGRFGRNTERALAAFQGSHGLRPSGRPDAPTLAVLAAAVPGAATLVVRIAAADVEGPFLTALPDDMMEKAKLPALAYTSVLEELAERVHAAPALLQRLNPRAAWRAGEDIVVPNVMPVETAGKAARIVVSKSTSTLEAFDAGGKLLFFAPVTAGSEHDPLPLGQWKVRSVVRHPTFAYNPDLFWDARPEHAKATIAAGPNNPVGVVWIDLDKEHYGIHGTAEPSKVGHAESHGCVRLTNWDAEHVADMVGPGTPVLFEN
jgi:lipoprotein-anchoring transpeptidase ErfK/SrfK